MRKYFIPYILWWFLLCVVLVTLLLFSREFFRNRNARLVFLDVGQGDATLLLSPRNRVALVDAGKYQNIGASLSRYLGAQKNIDILVATHPDLDHVAGMKSILKEFDVSLFLHSGLTAGMPLYRTIAKKINDAAIPAIIAHSGDFLFLDKDIFFEVLYPYDGLEIENPNDYSVVLMFHVHGKKVLLMGDASREVERKLVDIYGSYLESDILKIGHHGSKTSSSDIFIQTVKPKYAIISAGCNNAFGHPHATVLRVLDEYNIEELNTCNEGDIVFEFDKGDWVLQNKKSH